MEVIRQGDTRVTKIIHQKTLREEKNYRFSRFTYFCSVSGRYLIRNTLTSETAALTKAEYSGIKELKEAKPYSFLVQHGLTELARRRYIVEEEHDELRQYQQTVFLLRTMAGNKKGLRTYTIFPTTGCNARCIYCYEEGCVSRTMSAETADRLVDYICETRQEDPIWLRWFGGEPLAGANIIRRICSALQERGVPFKSYMITNASLMTKELAHEAREDWHLEKVQVSLDGAKEDYTVRKNYTDPERYNYDVVMQAIRFLADEGIRISLRVNVDFENIARIPGFLQEISERFADREQVTLYIAPLFQEQQGECCLELYREIFRLTDLQDEIGIPKSDKGANRKVQLRLNSCIADNIGKCITITPDGLFNTCEHLPEERTWGNIFDGVTDQAAYDALSAAPKIDEACAKCPFLPECTPFYKTGCPGWFKDCYGYHCLKTEHEMQNLLKGATTETDDDDEEL